MEFARRHGKNRKTSAALLYAQQPQIAQDQAEAHQRIQLQRQTTRPVAAQKLAVQSPLRAAYLERQEQQRVQRQRDTVSAQLAALPEPSTAAPQQQAQAVPDRPQTAAEWVTVMRHRAQQVDGKRLDAREYGQFTALQRQVVSILTQGFRSDLTPALTRHNAYGEQLARLQQHHLSAPVSHVVLSRLPPAERLSVQRAMTTAAQRLEAESRNSAVLDSRHALQRQLAELDAEATQPVLQRIQARRGGGNPLPEAIQRHLEQGLNHDLSRVRIHDDAEADRLAKGVNAIAFATGTDIFFRSGEFNPNTRSGLELLAHEVTHTVQQSQGKVGSGVDPDAGLEAEARTMGARLANRPVRMTGKNRVLQRPSAFPVQLQRQAALATSPAVRLSINSGRTQEFRALIQQYRQLVSVGAITPEEQRRVHLALNQVVGSIRSAEALAGRGSTARMLAAGSVIGAGGLAADDVTVVGVADDVAIPFVLLFAVGALAVSKLTSASTSSQQQAWQTAQGAVNTAVAVIGGVVAMGKRRSQTRTATQTRTGTTVATTSRQQPPVHSMRFQVQWGVELWRADLLTGRQRTG
ncbi:DUF4157 domain-containing protein [Deinococcus sp.]|uniref:eCIS core domain-containing protein n=1 Tax=Deinococcus sp. TaxID=47478 RepID=UPI0025BC6430|nr:DUF4157 domain-containing protein [Deinococcus sp.]